MLVLFTFNLLNNAFLFVVVMVMACSHGNCQQLYYFCVLNIHLVFLLCVLAIGLQCLVKHIPFWGQWTVYEFAHCVGRDVCTQLHVGLLKT